MHSNKNEPPTEAMDKPCPHVCNGTAYPKKEYGIMKIAFTTCGDSLNAPLDSRFGRAPRFLIYNDETGTLKVVDNQQNLNAAQGAGIQAASQIVKQNVDCVITGHCGPKAFQVLESADIKVYPCSAETIAEAYRLFTDRKLIAADAATVEGHW